MNDPEGGWLKYPVLPVPRGQGDTLLVPRLSDIPRLWKANRKWFATAARRLPDIVEARRILLSLADEYTSSYVGASSARCESVGSGKTSNDRSLLPIVMTGHQPEFFHPGVWFKNFVLDRLAVRFDAVPVHLIVDNDLCRTTRLRCPGYTNPAICASDSEARQVVWREVDLDEPFSPQPYECRGVRSEELVRSFGERAALAVDGNLDRPLVIDAWSQFASQVHIPPQLGYRVARFRHLVERAWGLRTLEVPLSRLCETDLFRSFVAQMVREARRTHEDYNRGLDLYRRANKLRSKSHPAASLQRFGPWVELPLWVWNRRDGERFGLFVEAPEGRLRFAAGPGTIVLDVADPVRADDVQAIVERLCRLSMAGWSVRPRALMTTLFARLYLCDLFIHGVGGAKYDVLVDWFISRWYAHRAPDLPGAGQEPDHGVPGYVTATATVHLPWSEVPADPEPEIHELQTLLRQIAYHPERVAQRLMTEGGAASVFDADTERLLAANRDVVGALIERKRQLITQGATDRRARHEALTLVNAQLRELLVPLERLIRSRLEMRLQQREARRALCSREVPFCFFPADFLRGLFEKVLA